MPYISTESEPMLDEFLETKVVIDLVSPYVCLGKLTRFDEHFLELKNADLHDLRDTETTRELYIADSVATGIKRNRKRVLIRRSEVVAISKLEDVVDE
jgi:small nuclear ribonucleoprotein (snRNP)-like protein